MKHAFAALAMAAAFVASASAQQIIRYAPHTGEILPLPAAKNVAPDVVLKGSGVNFTVVYEDGAGVGFNDATLGTQRKAVVNAVLAYLQTVLDHNGTCAVTFEASLNNGASPTLATASTLYFTNDGFSNGAAFAHITTNVDPIPGQDDIFVTVNFGHNYNLDLGANTTSVSEFDLFTLLLHEITHGLGIASLNESNGSLTAVTGTQTIFGSKIHQISNGAAAWGAPPSLTFAGFSLSQGDNTLEWRGAGAGTAYSASLFPRVFSPNPYQNGSSISHWQQNAPTPVSVMRPGLPNGTEIRAFHPFELEALEDIGYDASSADAWLQY
jgi:hypothetical protein